MPNEKGKTLQINIPSTSPKTAAELKKFWLEAAKLSGVKTYYHVNNPKPSSGLAMALLVEHFGDEIIEMLKSVREDRNNV